MTKIAKLGKIGPVTSIFSRIKKTITYSRSPYQNASKMHGTKLGDKNLKMGHPSKYVPSALLSPMTLDLMCSVNALSTDALMKLYKSYLDIPKTVPAAKVKAFWR